MEYYGKLEIHYYGNNNELESFTQVVKDHCAQTEITAIKKQGGDTSITSGGFRYSTSIKEKEKNGYLRHSLHIYSKVDKSHLPNMPSIKSLAIRLFDEHSFHVGTGSLYREERFFEHEHSLAVQFLAFEYPPDCMLLMNKDRWELYNTYPRSVISEHDILETISLKKGGCVLIHPAWSNRSIARSRSFFINDSIYLGHSHKWDSEIFSFKIIAAPISLKDFIEGVLAVIEKYDQIIFPETISNEWTDLEATVTKQAYLGSLVNYILHHNYDLKDQLSTYYTTVSKLVNKEVFETKHSSLISLMANRSVLLTVENNDFLIYCDDYKKEDLWDAVYVKIKASKDEIAAVHLDIIKDLKTHFKGNSVLGVNHVDEWMFRDIDLENYEDYLSKEEITFVI